MGRHETDGNALCTCVKTSLNAIFCTIMYASTKRKNKRQNTIENCCIPQNHGSWFLSNKKSNDSLNCLTEATSASCLVCKP